MGETYFSHPVTKQEGDMLTDSQAGLCNCTYETENAILALLVMCKSNQPLGLEGNRPKTPSETIMKRLKNCCRRTEAQPSVAFLGCSSLSFSGGNGCSLHTSGELVAYIWERKKHKRKFRNYTIGLCYLTGSSLPLILGKGKGCRRNSQSFSNCKCL